MNPRYNVNWSSTGEYFVGYANELDVWVEFPNKRNCFDAPIVLVVGPKHLVVGHAHYDVFYVEEGVLIYQQANDIHTTPHDMALIYQIATQEGVFTWKPETS
jgi:hypothetical protein